MRRLALYLYLFGPVVLFRLRQTSQGDQLLNILECISQAQYALRRAPVRNR
jgi:hypothetical protein